AVGPALPHATNGRAQHWYASQTSRTHARSRPGTARGERRARGRRSPGRESPAGAPSSCFGRLEVPVVVLGALGLADHVRGARPREEVVVLVRVGDRKSTRLNSSHVKISYAVFCLKKKKKANRQLKRTQLRNTT